MKCLIPIIGKYSKLDLTNKKLFYTSIIRPIMCYASPAWAAAKDSDIQKLQIIQNKYLHIITNAHKLCAKRPLTS
ncbi:hypothetical protein X975_18726, partial [Stegodyphus mimosarum]